MTDRELEERLALAARHAAPDRAEEVLSRIEDRKGAVIAMSERKTERKRWVAAACAALVLAGCGAGFAWQQSHAVASIVSLDVNPSIEVTVNKRERVIDCDALNGDAEKVLFEMNGGDDLKGVKVEVAMNALVGALVRNGYLDSLSSAILISVEDKNEQRAQQLEAKLADTVDAALQQQAPNAQVVSQTVPRTRTWPTRPRPATSPPVRLPWWRRR